MSSKQIVETLMFTVNEALANLHTCTIAKVTKVNAKTVNCKPVTNRLVDGVSIELPEFAEVPLLTLQGGSSYLHFPVAVGDYALLIFTERCFDGWYNGQDNQAPLEHRMHDYSDGIAIVGINPFADAISIPSVIQRTGNANHDGDVTHQGDRVQTGQFDLIGNMTITGDGGPGTMNTTNITINIVTGDVIADGISLKNHTHGGVQTGSGSTGVPE